MLRNPLRQDRYLATAQLGITVASLGLGMYGEQVLATWIAGWLAALGRWQWIGAHALASTVAVAILTYFHIVLGEMVPKGLALQRPEATAIAVTPVMIWIKRLTFPLVVGLNGLGNGLLRLIGVNRQEATHQQYHTPEELQYIIQESQEGGLLRAESGKVMRELFAFAELTAAEAMVPRVKVAGIPLDAAVDDLEALVRQRPFTRYPVYSGDLDHIVGIVHVRVLLRRIVAGEPLQPEDADVVPYVPETATLGIVLAAMRRENAQVVIVMDEHGGTAGIISITDLFDEITGEIQDEVAEPPSVARDASGRLSVEGTVRLDEVGDELGIAFEHPEVDTVSGLVLALLGRPPEVGDIVTYDDVRLEVTAVAGRGVQRAAVVMQARPPAAGGSDRSE
jgi:CBS domain containing-hemolysin-like protein